MNLKTNRFRHLRSFIMNIKYLRKKKKRSLEDFEFVNETRSGGTGKEIIGKGAFGSVKLAKEISTGSLFAIKAVLIVFSKIFKRLVRKYSLSIHQFSISNVK